MDANEALDDLTSYINALGRLRSKVFEDQLLRLEKACGHGQSIRFVLKSHETLTLSGEQIGGNGFGESRVRRLALGRSYQARGRPD